ncbi:MAG: lipid A-modifier LpxR family protein, partial [Steroidobacteraceae bacterium]
MKIRAATAGSIVGTMVTSRRHAPRKPLLTALVMLAASVVAHGEDSAIDVLDVPLELPTGGVSFQLDNDLFSGEGRDRDYSWGLAVTFASPGSKRFIAPVDRVRGQLASWLPRGTTRPSHISRASQLGILAMTPEDLTISDAQSDDRPYA